MIQFCADSFHSLAGQNVELPDWEENTMAKQKFNFGKPSKAAPPAVQAEDDGRPTCSKCKIKMHTGGVVDWVCQHCGESISNLELERRRAAGL